VVRIECTGKEGPAAPGVKDGGAKESETGALATKASSALALFNCWRLNVARSATLNSPSSGPVQLSLDALQAAIQGCFIASIELAQLSQVG